MSNRMIGNLKIKAALNLLGCSEEDLLRFARMVSISASRDSFLCRKATMLASQIADLIECLEKFQGDR